MPTPGSRFRAAVAAEKPLQVVGTINAYTALQAKRAGFRSLYLSGAGVANHSYGLPDIGKTELADVLIDARRIAQRVDLPLLVDIDTGWDDPTRAVRELAGVGVANPPSTSSSWRAPMRRRTKVCRRPFAARRPMSLPAPT